MGDGTTTVSSTSNNTSDIDTGATWDNFTGNYASDRINGVIRHVFTGVNHSSSGDDVTIVSFTGDD